MIERMAFLCHVPNKDEFSCWWSKKEDAIKKANSIALENKVNCFVLKTLYVSGPDFKICKKNEDVMEICDCAECDDFKDNKPHLKPEKDRYEEILRKQGFGVKRGEDGVAEVKPKFINGWITWEDGMCHPHEDDLVDLIFGGCLPLEMVRAGDYNWSRCRDHDDETPVISYYRPARIAEMQDHKKEPVADAPRPVTESESNVLRKALRASTETINEGYLADADGWKEHRQGDDMPCRSHETAQVHYFGHQLPEPAGRAGDFDWDRVTRWRYARQEQKAEEIDFEAELQIVTQERDKLKKMVEVYKHAADHNLSLRDQFKEEVRVLEDKVENLQADNDSIRAAWRDCFFLAQEGLGLVEALSFHLPAYYGRRKAQVKEFVKRCEEKKVY